MGERYQVGIRRSAQKQLGRVSGELRGQLIAAIKRLAHDPYPANAEHIKTAPGFRRIRVRNYRVVYAVAEGVVDVAVIAHRRDAYKQVLRIARS